MRAGHEDKMVRGPVYCYTCKRCGWTAERNEQTVSVRCKRCWVEDRVVVVMKRDFRAESVGIGSGVRESRRAASK